MTSEIEFLIKDDVIQVDKAIFLLRANIQQLKDENSRLKEENIQLKNRPEQSALPSQTSEFPKITMSKEKIDLESVKVSEWNSRHFVKYFMNKYFEKYNQPMKLRGKGYQISCFRIKEFCGSHQAINKPEDFKEYVDWLFRTKFNKNFVASVPLITSETMFYQWMVTRAPKPSIEKLRQAAASIPKSTKDIDALIKEVF